MAYLITGGARSGKSLFAEQCASRLASRGIYIATSRVSDDEEMHQRVNLHQQQREQSTFRWETIEEPDLLADRLVDIGKRADEQLLIGQQPPAVLVDCLTLWLTNRLLHHEASPPEMLENEINQLVETVASYRHPLLLVTNEVGSGIVPAYSLGRIFRDVAGRMNRLLAERCERVFLVASGIPVDLKRIAFSWDEL
ncbi:bifunctional adenosylcobinamide kinase/adenosylcobinamide-phosphate guanylyltransferase [Paenibacillus sp. MMS18-CY102]|uniref:bifunctional adenosylcobinamide kinase/adenosylcobinamide-phosphate guanylyltransferase n=1 Tax=Paenibacillus sp. MMS18-CY102 TaxID=2682849 RepID=UPI0019207B0C|nr:bifunctional adenosylcobinamide kinase/adenosylcobinamide-phosphate guanylyltransferase [Paenibacillus sp. MMS18-CY102]